jgi:hypothetical protein
MASAATASGGAVRGRRASATAPGQQPHGQGQRGGPADRPEQGEADCGDDVGHTQEHILQSVGTPEVLIDCQQEQGEDHDARAGTEVAVVHRDSEQPTGQQVAIDTTEPVLPPGGDARLQEQGYRGEDQEKRDDPPEEATGVHSSSAAPAAPPAAATTAHRRIHGHCPRNSGRDPNADPGRHVTNATACVTFAGSGGIPTSSSAGYEISEVMPPADPTAPARAPAANSSASSAGEVTASRREANSGNGSRVAVPYGGTDLRS